MIAKTTSQALLAASLLFALGQASAADSSVRRYPLPERGFFAMKVPANWVDQLRQPPEAVPPTIAFRPRQGKPFQILVTPIWRARPDIPIQTRETIMQRVERAIEGIKSRAVENNISIVEMSDTSGPGFYFSATDRAPKPDEYKLLTQGMLKVSDLLVAFTILTNDGQDDVSRDAFDMLRTAVHIQK